MKRRVLVVAAILVIAILGLVGCGKKEDTTGNINNNIENETSDGGNLETNNGSNFEKNEKFPYILIVNNERYEFPMTYDKLLSYGWVLDSDGATAEDIGESLMGPDASGTYFSGGLGFFNNENIIGAWPLYYNSDMKNEKKIKDCDVVGISFDDTARGWSYQSDSISIEGPNGTITIGISTKSDVCSFFDGDYYYMEDNGTIFVDYDMEDILSLITFKVE